MKKMFMVVMYIAFSTTTFAGVGGAVVNGVLKTWDDIAKIALKVSGRTTSDDAVKAAAKALAKTSAKYGDDVAKASMRGGIEVAEQVVKHGGRFARLVRSTAHFSDDVLRAMALNGDKAMRICAVHGEEVVKAIAKLPVEDGTRLLGAIEKNPQVARELIMGVENGGQKFLDRLFKINGRQILAGTLGAAAMVGVTRKTAPDVAEGRAVEQQTVMVTDLVRSGKNLSEVQRRVVDDWSRTTNGARQVKTWGNFAIGMTLIVFAGISFGVFVFRRCQFKFNSGRNEGSV